MNDRARRGRRPGPPLLLALGALVCFAPAPPLAAQSVESVLVERRLRLQQARADFEAARTAFSVVERQFSAALQEVGRARRSGEDDALERAYAVAQERSLPLRSQQERLDEAGDALDEARQALIDVISVRLGELVVQMNAAPSAAQRTSLDAIWRDLQNELRVLESEAEQTFRLDPVVLPEITFDPRDGPEDLRTKAQLLERQAAVADSVIQNTDRQLDRLSDRLRIQRQRGDLLAAVERFDDTRVPVVTVAPPGGGVAADSTGAGTRPLTLEERMEELRTYRAQLVAYRDQLLIKAETFRRRIRSVA